MRSSMTLFNLFSRLKGGTGSGNFGHGGRPGKHGGSQAGSSLSTHLSKIYANAPKNDEDVFNEYLFGQAKTGNITIDDASQLQEAFALESGPGHSVKPSLPKTENITFDKRTEETLGSLTKEENRWLMGADPEAKIDIKAFYDNFPEARNARLQMLHQHLSPDSSFEDFLEKPITVYRGGRPVYGDSFANFTLSKGTAKSFADKHGSGLFELNIQPKNILGYAPTGATEIFVEEGLRDGSSPRPSRIG